MKTKQQIRVEIKGISDEGAFDGLLSPYNNVDLGGDMVEPGAYTKTLSEHGNRVPLLWQHDATEPIGSLTLEDRPEGLYCKGQLLMELPEARKAHLLMKERIVKGLSIGYEAVKSQVLSGVRRLKEIRLYEGSVVTFPMNEQALISSIKSAAMERDDLASACLSLAASVLEAKSQSASEEKAGRRHSAATRGRMQNAIDILSALMSEEAGGGDATPEPQAADVTKSEPIEDHSAVSSLLKEAKELFQWNLKNNSQN
jgi:HK97 family phage prohead protease